MSVIVYTSVLLVYGSFHPQVQSVVVPVPRVSSSVVPAASADASPSQQQLVLVYSINSMMAIAFIHDILLTTNKIRCASVYCVVKS